MPFLKTISFLSFALSLKYESDLFEQVNPSFLQKWEQVSIILLSSLYLSNTFYYLDIYFAQSRATKYYAINSTFTHPIVIHFLTRALYSFYLSFWNFRNSYRKWENWQTLLQLHWNISLKPNFQNPNVPHFLFQHSPLFSNIFSNTLNCFPHLFQFLYNKKVDVW